MGHWGKAGQALAGSISRLDGRPCAELAGRGSEGHRGHRPMKAASGGGGSAEGGGGGLRELWTPSLEWSAQLPA